MGRLSDIERSVKDLTREIKDTQRMLVIHGEQTYKIKTQLQQLESVVASELLEMWPDSTEFPPVAEKVR